MAKKSNKTSHVLNLITGSGTEAEAQADEGVVSAQPAAAPEQTKEPAPSVPVPAAQPEQKVIVIDEATENDKLSNTIKNSLEDHLKEMEGQSVQEQVQEPVLESEPEQISEPVLEAEPEQAPEPPEPLESKVEEEVVETAVEAVPEPTQEPEIAEKAPEPEKKPEMVAAVPEQTKEPEVAYHMINVMEQILNRQNLLKQINDYGVCNCSRCQADVLALTLTRLPAKYVVVDKSSTAPIIGYYESKFKVRIFTEIMKACIKVKDEPRHEL